MVDLQELSVPSPEKSDDQHKRLLTVPLDSHRPQAWDDALFCILRFAGSSTTCYRQHVDQRTDKYDHGISNYSHDGVGNTHGHFHWDTVHEWKALLDSGDWKSNWKAREEWGAEIQGIHPLVYRERSTAEDNHHESKEQQCRLLDLPVEIFERIFEFVGGSYELEANLLRLCHYDNPGHNSTQLIFYKPRIWAQLNIFQICRAFRNLAIHHYGVPQRNSLPFNPKSDTVVIYGETLDCFGLDRAKSGVAYSPNLYLQDWSNENHWLLHDGVYSIYDIPSNVRPWSTPIKTSTEFLRRVEHITMAVDDGTTYQQCWEPIWRFLTRTFINTECMKFNISHMDNCGHQMKPGQEKKPKIVYKVHDLWLLYGIAKVIFETGPSKVFPNLRTLEVEKIATCCTYMWDTRMTESPSHMLGWYLVE